MNKKNLFIFIFVILISSCSFINSSSSDFFSENNIIDEISSLSTFNSASEDVEVENKIYPIIYENIQKLNDPITFIKQVNKKNGEHDNDAKEIGIIKSNYLS